VASIEDSPLWDLFEVFVAESRAYGINDDGTPGQPIAITYAKTKLKRQPGLFLLWNSGLALFTTGSGQRPPLYAHQVTVYTFPDTATNPVTKKTHNFYNVMHKPLNGTIPDSLIGPDNPLFIRGKALAKSIADGESTVGHETAEASGGEGQATEEDIPF